MRVLTRASLAAGLGTTARSGSSTASSVFIVPSHRCQPLCRRLCRVLCVFVPATTNLLFLVKMPVARW